MSTTLTLIDSITIDTRKDGAISYAKVRVLLDGAAIVTDFRARVGEEPVTIEGDTITVSDAQIEARRQALAYHAREDAKRADAEVAKIAEARAKLDGFAVAKGLNAAATSDLIALFTATGRAVTFGSGNRDYDAYVAGVRAIVARNAA